MLQAKFRMTRAAAVVLMLVMLVLHSSSSSPLSSNFTDQQSLLAFKSQIIDHNGYLTNNWTESTNFCSWVGVLCSKRHPRVTGLVLPEMGLGGTISPHIGNLSFLMVLHLGNNSFHGQIIHEISHLRRLEILRLYFNNFEGLIPQSLKHCQHLQVISLLSNKLVGPIPEELSTLPRLHTLYLGKNNLTGTIPSSLANISTLEGLGLEYNQLHGNIPDQLAYLPKLTIISAGANHLSGPIPPRLFNLSSLQVISLSGNGLLTGELPSNNWLRLPNLRTLTLAGNQLTGQIPSYLSNLTMLTLLDLGSNQFSGTVPTSLGNLELLTFLAFGGNNLTLEPDSHELSFLTALTSLKLLEILSISFNPFKGSIPFSIGNLSSSLQWFDATNCQIKGQIPESIGSLNQLNYLHLSENSLSGSIPPTIKGMKSLQRLHVDQNRLEGSIPSEICHLNNLGEIYLQNNVLSGPIPTCIGNLSSLQSLFLSSNTLNSTIPSSLWSLGSLLTLNLSFNSLHGGISPDFVGSLRSMRSIDLSWNKLSGNIPENLGSFQSLGSLNLSHNSVQGPIPESLGKLISLDFMDLSYNNLSGPIPKSLESITDLKLLNLTHNMLSGEVPSGGPFANLTADSFLENEELCGRLISKPCKGYGSQKSKHKIRPLIYFLPAILAAVLVFGVSLYVLKRQKRRNMQNRSSGSILEGSEPQLFSYQQLCRATNNFCEANLLGVGSFGSVYKGTLSNGEIVAVKLLNLQVEGAMKSFDAECKVIRSVRHRNLVKIITSCTNPELRALVLEYMPNGSLHKWLYSHNYLLSLLQRVTIMLDVALAVEYLHHGLEEVVVHRDLKPSNVLLDEDMVAHVGDFGIAKIMGEYSTAAQTNTLGTIGYIPPEYGVDGRVSAKGDIYSFGVMVLETFTRKRPTDEMFVGELNLKKWVNLSVRDQITEVVDQNLLSVGNKGSLDALHRNLFNILDLAMECCHEVPEKRSDIKDIVLKLNKIKSQVLSEVNG